MLQGFSKGTNFSVRPLPKQGAGIKQSSRGLWGSGQNRDGKVAKWQGEGCDSKKHLWKPCLLGFPMWSQGLPTCSGSSWSWMLYLALWPNTVSQASAGLRNPSRTLRIPPRRPLAADAVLQDAVETVLALPYTAAASPLGLGCQTFNTLMIFMACFYINI